MSALSKFSVLIVDDQEESTAAIKLMLERRDFEVIYAKNTKEAMTKLEEYAPHLLIVDINLGPDDSGLKWLAKVRKSKFGSIPAVMLTGAGDVDTVKESTQVGIDDYIIKPADTKVLAKKIVSLQAKLQKASTYALKTVGLPLVAKMEMTVHVSAISETGFCISSYIVNRKPISFLKPESDLFEELKVSPLKKITFLNYERESNSKLGFPIRNYCQANGWSEPDFKEIRLWIRRNQLGRNF